MSTYAVRQQLIAIARAEVGTVEIGTSNTGKRIRQYQAATSLGGTGWPWCAAFVCWCIREWLRRQDVLDALRMTAKQAEAWRPKTAAAYGFHEWAAEKKLLQLDDQGRVISAGGRDISGVEQPLPLHTADLVTYDFSHIGIVANDEGPLIYTIEGNTDGAGSREGGGVFEKVRQRNLARRFIRMLP